MMKGYLTSEGFFGWVEDRYILFPTEEEYYEFIRENS